MTNDELVSIISQTCTDLGLPQMKLPKKKEA
jgi:hypothetical protein